MERAVVEEVRSALANRRPLARVTWSTVQELISRRIFTELRDQGSTEVQKYVDEFDKELKSKQRSLRTLSAKFHALRRK
ncbi:protein of unknown function [Ralstonia solanacearum CMR15]|nr:protein of unknown function [Ralstonia solanacearum CMR15]